MDSVDLIVVVLPPLPVRLLVGMAATVVIDVLAVRIVLPLDVVCFLARSPLPARDAPGGQKRNRQRRDK